MRFQLRVGKVESMQEWINTMIEHETNKSTVQKDEIPAYKMSINTDPGCYYPHERVLLKVYERLYNRYRRNGYRLRYLPTELDVMYKHRDDGDPNVKRFAMNLSDKFKAGTARFGIFHKHRNSFMPFKYYENGVEVKDEGKKAVLFGFF